MSQRPPVFWTVDDLARLQEWLKAAKKWPAKGHAPMVFDKDLERAGVLKGGHMTKRAHEAGLLLI